MRNYAITLTFQSGGMLQLPILPEKLKVSSPGKNKTAIVLGIGEVLLLRLKGLRSVSWDSFFPASSAPYVTGSIITPVEAVRAIQSARDSCEPVQFTLSGSDLDINTQMGVEDFSYDERFGAVGDIYYSIKLSEWKDYSPRRLILSDSGTKTAAAETPKERGGATPVVPKTYTVVRGDSLWAISKRLYGSGSKWTDIYSANKGTIGANPNKIYPGQVFTIP